MPRYPQYFSAMAVINADGTTTFGDIAYEWNGSEFVKALYTILTDARETEFRIEQTARNALEGNLHVYDDIFGGRALIPTDIAWLRLAIERGHISLDRALADFGSFRASGATHWAFTPSLPDRLSEGQELAFFGDFPGPQLRVADVLTKPNAYVNTSVTDLLSSTWTTPPGVSLERAIGEAWSNHSTPEIARAADLLLGGISQAAPAESRIDFALAITQNQDWIQKLYLAFFLRPADPGGYNYYAHKLEDGQADISSIANGFGNSPEYLQTYAGMTTAERIDAIYRNLFGRPAEPDGLRYWGERLDPGTFTISNIAFSILLGAQNADAIVINNRLLVSKQFTAALDTQSELQAYSGLDSATAARQLLSPVTAEASSVAVAATKIGRTMKFLGVVGQVTADAIGDTVALGTTGKAHTLFYSDADRGRLDVVSGFQAADRIDLTALGLTNMVQTRALAAPQRTDSPGFFTGVGAVIDNSGSDAYVYLDVDKNGAFSPSADTTIRLVGADLQPSNLTI